MDNWNLLWNSVHPEVGMVPGETNNQKSYQGELGGQIRFMYAIEIMEFILGSTTLVVNICDNTSTIRQAKIRPELVESIWKEEDLISHLSDVYQSMESGMPLVHIYRHHNSVNPASTLISVASLNIGLDALAEHIMVEFILSPVTRNKIVIGLSYLHGILSASIHKAPIHSKISQSITYEISKLWLLQYWDNLKLTHMADCDIIELTLFKRAQDTTTVHMEHFIKKYMSYTLPTMKVLQRQGHATTNVFPRCGVNLEKILHLYQFTHKGSHGIRTSSIDVFQKWLEARNTDPYIAIVLADALLYIAGEINDLPQCPT